MDLNRAAFKPLIKFLVISEKLIANDLEKRLDQQTFGLLRLAYFQIFKKWPKGDEKDD